MFYLFLLLLIFSSWVDCKLGLYTLFEATDTIGKVLLLIILSIFFEAYTNLEWLPLSRPAYRPRGSLTLIFLIGDLFSAR